MNRKGAIFIKEIIGGCFIVRIYGLRCSLVNSIAFITQCPRMKRPYEGTKIDL